MIDLLADRSVDSTVAWLRAHPGIEIVSRDRSSVYSEAAVRAAQQAMQIADRWHLLRNLSEALIGALAPYHRLMTEAAQAVCGKPSLDAVEMPCATSRMNQREAAKQRSRERRVAVYDTAMKLIRGGLPQPEVARRLSIDSRTIRRWVESNGFPEQSFRCRKSSLDRYREYLEQRWQQGCHNAAQLWRELREKGFSGTSPSHITLRSCQLTLWLRVDLQSPRKIVPKCLPLEVLQSAENMRSNLICGVVQKVWVLKYVPCQWLTRLSS